MLDDGLLKVRDEILGFQRAIVDLQKWKLIGIGTAVTVGLGMTEKTIPTGAYALFAVPFLTVYCDLLKRDYDLRIAVLGGFVMSKKGLLSDYEAFLARVPKGAFLLGALAGTAASCAANAVLVWFVFSGRCAAASMSPAAYLASAVAGTTLCLGVEGYYQVVRHAVMRRAQRPIVTT